MMHIRIDKNFIKREIDEGGVSLSYIPTVDQLADVLTKVMFKPRFESLISKLGMTYIYFSI